MITVEQKQGFLLLSTVIDNQLVKAKYFDYTEAQAKKRFIHAYGKEYYSKFSTDARRFLSKMKRKGNPSYCESHVGIAFPYYEVFYLEINS
jgi:hypothetical protein